MSDPKEPQAPKVFISYSHDTPAHKKWVADLASKLMSNGIQVTLDQWEIGPGDDVPKFMEKGVSEADCVLMICTEAYVRKADDGKGGVGYEAMIVTGELVKNLGTSKFVPIIRQENGGGVLPKSVSTRFYVNLSDEKSVEEQFKELLHKVHKVPKVKKPELGKNPFVGELGGGAAPAVVPVEVKVEDASAMYAAGLAIAQRGDLMGWRKLVQKTREPLAKNLSTWRSAYEGKAALVADLPRILTEGSSIYSPLMSLAVAGAVSGNAKFSNQTSILDELIGPAGWNVAGMTYLTQIPSALVFTFQAVHGAACLFSGELMRGVAMSRARVRDSYSSQMDELFKQPPLVGWPYSLNERPDFALSYLVGLFDNWAWLAELFGSKEEYKSSLVAYYLGLHVQELANLIASGNDAVLEADGHMPLVPIQSLRIEADQGSRSYRLLVHSPEEVRAIWRTLGVKDAQMAAAWDKWLSLTLRAMTAYRGQGTSWRRQFPHENLLKDIRPEGAGV
ncbi:toll/interleukin-1 receptor domain-containing protein [Pedosphaera parvula]|uniref:SEFIR domain protein n=1 Tax=Pedosphaera parvula (strain Ellin514) TaxID=320771 RepID=B9XT12_PEDPL|nr:toll/interleukin-1 receptor domain-containing protein [Pedosphaera parvula]EEF57022.1 SEFIR domain protein [Pedosphaera parvula Ellin514]